VQEAFSHGWSVGMDRDSDMVEGIVLLQPASSPARLRLLLAPAASTAADSHRHAAAHHLRPHRLIHVTTRTVGTSAARLALVTACSCLPGDVRMSLVTALTIPCRAVPFGLMS